MDNDDKDYDVVGASQIEYAIHLTKIYNWLFPPLLDKALDFYIWYFTEKEPQRFATADSIEYVLSVMDEDKPDDTDSLVSLVQRMTIPDGIAVREAIRTRLNHLETGNGMMRITKNGVVPIVRDCMTAFAELIRQSEEETPADDTTTEKSQ